MSIEKAAAETRACQAKLADGIARLNQAASLIYEARTILHHATQGTSRPEAGQALITLVHAQNALEAHRQLAQAASVAVETYLANVARGTGTATTSSTTVSPTGVPARPSAVPPERIEQLRRELPPDITPPATRRPGTPQPKTHGRWMDPSGQVHEEISGWDDKYRAAIDWFKSQPGRKRPATASDVEVKLAVHMRQNILHHVTLVINHVPREGNLGATPLSRAFSRRDTL
ncbi:DddA-like double-stranded DNA deaminase toxin [Actinokineospora sp. 24-640]